MTDTTIAIGIPYCSDCSAADAAIGADGEDPGDTRNYFKAAIAEVNSRGGVLGRKLVPVFHQISASDNIDRSAQEACETFTKDNKVAAIFFRGEITYQCAKNAGIIAVGQGGSGPLFTRYPNLFVPGDIRLERLGAATVKGMVAAGWHKPDTTWPTGKIGLITWDDNEYTYAMKSGWLPALRESGLKETDVRYVAVPQSDKSLADSSAAISAAVLSFRDQGIDHVFISDGPAGIFRGGGLTLQFMNAAKSQRYYPRYGFNTNNAPGNSALPADQQVGMIAVDSNDLEKANDDGIALNPQRERCYALMKKSNLKATDGRPTGILAIGACGIAWFTEAVFNRATAGTELPRVIAAAESLGSSYRSPGEYGTRLGPGRHDGVSFFRNARFDTACSCMRYTSKPYEP
ncbi:MAG: ABC transporter substrate-binding protein [Actinobacteria bacterium]|nr:ABC transporter substrate-binding protein [Actinomycetota bacterium]